MDVAPPNNNRRRRPWALLIDLDLAGLTGSTSVLRAQATVGVVRVRTLRAALPLLARADEGLAAVFVADQALDPSSTGFLAELRQLAPLARLYVVAGPLGAKSSVASFGQVVHLAQVPGILEGLSQTEAGA